MNPPITTYYGFHLNESMAYPRVTICRRPGYKTDLFPVSPDFQFDVQNIKLNKKSCNYFSILTINSLSSINNISLLSLHSSFSQRYRYLSLNHCVAKFLNISSLQKYGLRSTQTIHNQNVFRNFDFSNYTIKEFLNETTYSFSELVGSYAFNGIGFSSGTIATLSFT